MVHTRADLTSDDARRALTDVDVLWHLGAQLWRSRDDRQAEVNIGGTANVLAARPAHVVLASSAAVYGAYPTNPVPITEDLVARPNQQCPYAQHKLEAERLCRESASTSVMRISAVLGPHADPQVMKATRGYRAAVPALKRRGGGYIFNVSSLAGKNAFAGGAAYNASKFGLNGFSEAVMLDLRYHNIRLSYIMPGSVETSFGRSRGSSASAQNTWKIDASDVAEVVIDLLKSDVRTMISRVEMRPSKPPR